MSDDEDDLIDLDEAWESPPMSPHERRLWGPGAEASPQTGELASILEMLCYQ